MKEKKYYVVWKGKKIGVFDTWKECSSYVQGVQGSEYKSFKTKELANEAFQKNSREFIGKDAKPAKLSSETSVVSKKKIVEIGTPISESIAVDAACNMQTGDMEYKGVYTATGKVLFQKGVYKDATNNIGEFLAIVHGLAYLKQKGSILPIYSDSKTALAWLRNKKAKTNQPITKRNEDVFELIKRAEIWLQENTYENLVLKWETEIWGEIPADFGRK
jgi:ribonuclease HI